MSHILKPAYSLAWLFSQAVTVGGLGVGYFLVPFAILAVLALLGILWRGTGARPRLWIPVLLLPAIWIVTGLWAGALWVDPSHQFRYGSWVQYPPLAAIAFSLIASVFFFVYQRGARLFVASYSIINLYITVMISFGSLMAVTGSWI